MGSSPPGVLVVDRGWSSRFESRKRWFSSRTNVWQTTSWREHCSRSTLKTARVRWFRVGYVLCPGKSPVWAGVSCLDAGLELASDPVSDRSLLSGRGRFVPTGVLEALCIQAPEQTGRELVRIAPRYWNAEGNWRRDPGKYRLAPAGRIHR